MIKEFLDRLYHKLRFNLWYLKEPPWDTGISPPELHEFIYTHAPGRALDLGCGTGTNVITLAQAGWSVTGVDFALRAVHTARQKLSAAGISSAQIYHGDITKLEALEKPFDLILDIGCFHGLSPQSRRVYIQNLELLLAPQGFYLLYAHLNREPSAFSGIIENEITLFQNLLRLVQRKDGFEGDSRPSVWLTFQKVT